jgi:hypothetical protein
VVEIVTLAFAMVILISGTGVRASGDASDRDDTDTTR